MLQQKWQSAWNRPVYDNLVYRQCWLINVGEEEERRNGIKLRNSFCCLLRVLCMNYYVLVFLLTLFTLHF